MNLSAKLKKKRNKLENTLVLFSILAGILLFIPSLNPARVTGLINHTMSLFTSAVSYTRLTSEALRAIRLEWVNESSFTIIFISSIIVSISVIISLVGTAFSVGNLKFRNLEHKLIFYSNIFQLIGIAGFILGYSQINQTTFIDRVQPVFPSGIIVFGVIALINIFISFLLILKTPKALPHEKFEMERPYQLLVMYLPFMILVFVFSYLPLWGWRYAFFDYQAGQPLTWDNFVGFKWLMELMNNANTRKMIGQVMINTFIMSGLGLAFSWLPMVFAMFLAEITSKFFKRFIQFFTTIPNFISWVLVFALALAMFSSDGFVNGVLMNWGVVDEPIGFLKMGDSIWLQMWAWGTWKSLGWSAIIYIAAISSIDPVLYESAKVDGANRFQKMRYITLPSILPTYFVLLILQIAAILSNGMDQYLVFYNTFNAERIQVLDLYVYRLGLRDGQIPLSTLVGMLKSIVSIVLLFSVNKISKKYRGESIF